MRFSSTAVQGGSPKMAAQAPHCDATTDLPKHEVQDHAVLQTHGYNMAPLKPMASHITYYCCDLGSEAGAHITVAKTSPLVTPRPWFGTPTPRLRHQIDAKRASWHARKLCVALGSSSANLLIYIVAHCQHAHQTWLQARTLQSIPHEVHCYRDLSQSESCSWLGPLRPMNRWVLGQRPLTML